MKTTFFRTMVSVLFAIGGQSALGAPLATATPESVGMSSERLARIAPAMQRYIDDRLVPGTITAVMRRGKLVHLEMQGDMDVENGRPMQRDAIFRIASMTKPITSVALMMLWEEGHFQLRDPVAKFLPEFADPLVSTTSDSPSQLPFDQPIQVGAGGRVWFSM